MHERRTKIVATLGPATDAPGALDDIVRAGVDVVRLNMSHGAPEEHRSRVRALREAAHRLGRVVGVLCDLQGPKIRIAGFRDGPVTLESGSEFFIDPSLGEADGTVDGVGIGYAGLPGDVSAGDVLLLNDGLIRLQVERVEGTRIHTRVEEGGRLSDRKGVNRLGGGLSLGALTDKDREDLAFAAGLDIDYLAVSFPRSADDLREARSLLEAAGGGDAGIVAKIERREALDGLPEIMQAADAVMIARGDLAVEIGDARLPGVQKRIMRLARERDCVVITATQMMQSMVESPTPTRAEVLDVANAVLDGTDAVMLSEETAAGRHPSVAVAAMARVCIGAEDYADEAPAYRLEALPHYDRIDETIAKVAIDAANRLGAAAIAALTESGATVMWMSRIGTDIPVYALSEQARTRGRVTLYRGVWPVEFDSRGRDPGQVSRDAVEELRRLGAVKEGDRVLVTKGDQQGVRGGTNTLKIVEVPAS